MLSEKRRRLLTCSSTLLRTVGPRIHSRHKVKKERARATSRSLDLIFSIISKMELADLLCSLPATMVSDRGLLESVAGMRMREHSRPAEASASRLLLEEKRSAAAAEAAAPPFVLTNFSAQTPKSNPLHEAIVSGHKQNMEEILARNAGREKSKRANRKDRKTTEKSAAYSDRLTAKTGGQQKRSQRLNAFKKAY